MSSECNEAKPPVPPWRGPGNDSSVRLSPVWHNSKPVPLVTPSPPPLMLQSLQIIAAARKSCAIETGKQSRVAAGFVYENLFLF